ncbi:MAG: pyruvate, phosphate dikinase [Chloroflexi bacterium]|nr:pyruvate, phosphate dikinase [Chloroflexota bacterium]
MAKKWVYLFNEGNRDMRDTLGGKGAGLAEMTNAGLPVPPGFIITTEACNEFFQIGKKFPEGMWDQVEQALRVVEQRSGKTLGDARNPLLLSVRSGAKFSMPGMMDTVLNLGLNQQTLHGLIEQTGNSRFGYDAYRRLVQMFGKIVLDIPGELFERVMQQAKNQKGVQADTDLTTDDLKAIAEKFKQIIQQERHIAFPEDVFEQLRMSIEAVFDSWWGKRATDYRNNQKISHDLGTAVNVMAMVFGNMGFDSGTGVAFTRDPATGEKVLYGEYLPNAQGEDVVAGIRTPLKISQLKDTQGQVYQQFVEVADQLERHYRDMQDLEFTIEHSKLWMLQTRTGKRTAQAAVKVAVDMANEGLISREEAVLRVEPEHIDQLLHPRFDDKAKQIAQSEGKFLAKGLNASPGAAVGQVAFNADLAEKWGRGGRPVILVRPETNPDDVHGMLQAKGILTQHGGATSHAAVVARGIGLACVAGCESLRINLEDGEMHVNGQVVHEADYISIDGATGEVFLGQIPTVVPKLEEQQELVTLLTWADEFRRLGVWANADYPRDARQARAFGATGVGLCRTEHMFFETERLPIVRKMILAETKEVRQTALDQLLPIQRGDFEGILEAMAGYPVVIRLIDPPLHEFLPRYEDLLVEVTELRVRGNNPDLLAEKEALLQKVSAMREANPMLGLRGCRLGVLFPEITEMQVRAIIEAAINLKQRHVDVHPEIMIPLVGHVNELKDQREKLEAVVKQVQEERGTTIGYKFGTMIEIPRAALTADEVARYAEFFSFGTNDLTQTTFGISRDDAEGKFLLEYVERKILPANPFQQLDRQGVGQLMKIAVERGRATRPDLEVGICGEHGGDPSSIEFCHEINLDYVSCSPFRVPVARLAAAHTALKDKLEIRRDK